MDFWVHNDVDVKSETLQTRMQGKSNDHPGANLI